jgi:hypothetical protein
LCVGLWEPPNFAAFFIFFIKQKFRFPFFVLIQGSQSSQGSQDSFGKLYLLDLPLSRFIPLLNIV